MTEASRPLRCTRRALLLATGAAAVRAGAQQRVFTLGLLSQADDERYAAPSLQRGFPDAPAGRSAPAAQVALDDSALTLQAAGYTSSRVLAVEAADAAGIAASLQQLWQQGARHIVLELPAAGVTAAAAAGRGKDLVLFNAAAPEDSLRAAQCAPQLLHTLPSHAMQMDAIVQLLVQRKWSRPLLLYGPAPGDRLLLAAFQRAARRFGLRTVAERAFKLSNEPRERELGNVRLLTSEREYDAVVVLDAQGEFARELPYRTVLPRPVLGSNGLTAQAWHPLYERNGAPQLSRRFQRQAGRPMGSYDWATWMAARAAAEAASADPRAAIAQQLQALRQGSIALDGYKGQRLGFRPWDGQLRQPLLLAHGNGIADLAPLEGFLHPRSTLDTLGYDAPETGCKAA
jgi:ABC transporter substrate binding protein (PQQ-dependent alcohol dehydrogenase system)